MARIRKFQLSPHAGTTVAGLGLLTEEPDYRLCWMLNRELSWNLARTDDLTIPDKGSPVSQSYPCFETRVPQGPAVRIIGNRSQEGSWLTRFRHIDFILVISPPDPTGSILEGIKSDISTKIPQIRGLFNLQLPSFCYL